MLKHHNAEKNSDEILVFFLREKSFIRHSVGQLTANFLWQISKPVRQFLH